MNKQSKLQPFYQLQTTSSVDFKDLNTSQA